MNKTPVKIYARKENVFSQTYLNNMRSHILNSPYLNVSQLGESFDNTKGFSIIFKRSTINQVIDKFPWLKPYLEATLKQACNAFYCNVLILESGTRVAEHTDCSISSYDMIYTNPRLVSVFYVDIPQDIQGGELVLSLGEENWQIQPQTNSLIFFLGHLSHQVNQVTSSQPRISLVCEQYHLSSERLQNIPEFEIKSGAMQQQEVKHEIGNN